MNILLNNEEILDALEQYIKSKGISIKNKHVETNLIAGRKGNGNSAEIIITDLHTEPPPDYVLEPGITPALDLKGFDTEL